MNRDLKFRFWDIETKSMIFATLEHLIDGGYYISKDSITMQYTGLQDKTKDKQDIYEGDILQTKDGIMIVEYNYDRFECIDSNDNNFRLYDYIYFGFTKVIGNIYENQDLIK